MRIHWSFFKLLYRVAGSRMAPLYPLTQRRRLRVDFVGRCAADAERNETSKIQDLTELWVLYLLVSFLSVRRRRKVDASPRRELTPLAENTGFLCASSAPSCLCVEVSKYSVRSG